MPGMDGTGPLRNGPFGRGLGPCCGGQANWGRGRGMGFRRGGWFGWGQAPITAEQEKMSLEQQKSWLESQLYAITTRLQNIKED